MNTAPKAAQKTEDLVDASGDAIRKSTASIEGPARDLAEKGVQQAKESYSRIKAAAEETTDAFEDSFATASKGYKEFTRKSVEATRSNVNAHFDFLQSLIGAKSLSQAVELQTAYAKRQVEVLTGQAKELSSLAQRAATEGSKPLQEIATKSFRYAQAS